MGAWPNERKQAEDIYNPGTHLQRVAENTATAAAVPTPLLPADNILEHGKQIYSAVCVACHQADGRGVCIGVQVARRS